MSGAEQWNDSAAGIGHQVWRLIELADHYNLPLSTLANVSIYRSVQQLTHDRDLDIGISVPPAPRHAASHRPFSCDPAAKLSPFVAARLHVRSTSESFESIEPELPHYIVEVTPPRRLAAAGTARR